MSGSVFQVGAVTASRVEFKAASRMLTTLPGDYHQTQNAKEKRRRERTKMDREIVTGAISADFPDSKRHCEALQPHLTCITMQSK